MSLIDSTIAARAKQVHVTTDTHVPVILTYVGTGTVTSVTVTAATNIVMVTSDGGTDTYAFATYATVGSLVDKINSDGIFKAKVNAGLRSDATASVFVDGAITATVANGKSVYEVKADTSAALNFTAVAKVDDTLGKDLPTSNKVVLLKKLAYAINMGTAAMDGVQVFLRKGTVETQVLKALSVDTTATSVFDYSTAPGYSAFKAFGDEELIVRVKDAATLADAAGNYLTLEYEVIPTV